MASSEVSAAELLQERPGLLGGHAGRLGLDPQIQAMFKDIPLPNPVDGEGGTATVLNCFEALPQSAKNFAPLSRTITIRVNQYKELP